jgi:O-methyltransferase
VNERIRNWIAEPGTMMNVCRMMDIYHLLSQVVVFGVEGSVVELGAHEGQSAILIQEIVNYHRTNMEFHVYDSFSGLPERHEYDAGGYLLPGDLSTSESVFLNNFALRSLEPPIVHCGWFHDTLPDELPRKICFVHIDSDFYTSVIEGLEAVYPRLADNAIVVIDDYDWEGLPGVKIAVNDFLQDKPEKICSLSVPPEFDAPHAFFRYRAKA